MKIAGKKFFLTGATGFIGGRLLERLSAASGRITALVRRTDELPGGGITPVVGDLLEPESFASVLGESDLVFHCAASVSFRKKDFRRAYRVNVEGTKNVLEAAHRGRVEKVVHLSAGAVLGFSSDRDALLDETADPVIEKENVYAYTKKLAEAEVQKHVREGLDVSIANIATVYGPGDRKLNSGSIIKAIYEEKMRFVPPGGTSYVAVEDLVDGLLLLAEKGRPGERYIFSTENLEFKELARRIARTLKVREPGYTLPRLTYYPALGAIKLRELLSGPGGKRTDLLTAQILKEAYGYKYFSSKKAKEELGWRPTRSLEAAVEGAFRYYRENRLL